jgi:phosphate starvation-inducible protein PhoH and related proteins
MNAAAIAELYPEEEHSPRTKRVRVRKVQNKEMLSLRHVSPMTFAQEQMMEGYARGAHIVAAGSAGTGKSFLASYLALDSMFNKDVEKIVVVRSAVPTRDVGFLPGNLQEKTEVYTIPYKQIFNDLCENGTAWDILTKKNMVEFITTSYVRGITLDNCVVIVDEFQSMTAHELYSVLTRLGNNTRLIISGDTKQTDLDGRREKSSFDWFMKVTQKMGDWFEVVNFTSHDIVRSKFVKQLIMAVED